MKKPIFTILVCMFIIGADAQVGIGTTTPNSTLDVRGSIATSYRAFTANTTASATDNLLVFTGTGAATLTLPTAVGCDGRTYMIKNASTTGPTPVLTIATTSSQTIDGAPSWTLSSAYETITVISNGAGWNVSAQSLPGGSGVNWTQNGNSVASQKSIGTINNYSLPFITNNTERMRLSNTGNLGIGTSSFNATHPEKLVVDAGTTTSVNAIVGKGSIDNYLQLNIQNNSAGANASSDVVATANNGSETTNYVDMGINGGSNASGIMGGANDAYLYNIGQNLLIGTGSASKSLVFMTGGTSQSSNERMRIDGTGDVGIGTNTIPKNAVGAARFAIDGTNASLSGPHVQFTTAADNYPVLQNLNWAHDYIYNGYDAYFDGAWRSGTGSGGNFVMGKEAGKFVLQYGTNNTAGTIISWNNGIVLNNAGKFAIGTQTFNATNPEKLLVDAGTTSSVNAIVGKGSIDNYLQLNIQNNSAGANASSDVVATANNGSETTNYIDMGINGGGNTSGIMGAANDGYLYNIGQNLLIGTGSASKSLVFMTGGTSQASNERMRIDGSGNVGIGTNNPSEKLDIVGNLELSGAFMPGGSAGTSGQFLVSAGAGASPTWANASGYAWLLNGNSVPAIRSIGTTNAYDLPFITSNTERMRINTNGDVGIGTTTFNATNPEQLIVNAGTPTTITDFQNVIVGKGNTNSYAQLNIQNTYSAANNSASSDVVATSDNGNESSNFIDMGINSGTNTTTGILGGGNTAYLYSTGNNFAIGNATASKDIMIFTGGTAAANERMRINGSGNVGIGNNNPNSTLSVTGSHSVSYRSGTGAYTVLATDYVVINTGGAATWTMPAASGCTGRMYRLLNHGTGNITLSASVTTANGTTTTTLGSAAGSNYFEVISDGSVWRLLK